jgi:hypothetical protein
MKDTFNVVDKENIVKAEKPNATPQNISLLWPNILSSSACTITDNKKNETEYKKVIIIIRNVSSKRSLVIGLIA